MATLTGVQAKSATLTSTTVDTITLSNNRGNLLTVVNRAAAGGTAFWCTYGPAPATPTAGGDDCYPVPPDFGSISFRIRPGVAATVVKILGNGHDYTVMITDAPGT